jgi:hypothetical protein
MVASMKRYASVIGASVLGFAALLTWATPASAAAVGETASCTFPTTTTAQCNFPVLSASYSAEIHYVTVQCSSTGIAYNLKEVEVLAIPPQATADVGYEMAGNRASVAGVANVGAIVDIYVKADTTSEILIDFSVVPTGTTTCTASLTATY